MRRLLLVAPVLLVGCSVFEPSLPDPGAPFIHDGYTLTCGDVPIAPCISRADALAAPWSVPRGPVESITFVSLSEFTVCWASAGEPDCMTLGPPAP